MNDPGAKCDLGFVPLWTPQYEPDTGNDGIRILDGRGRVVARVGEHVTMGGGGIDRKTLEERDFMEERSMRKLFGRCSGNDYWMVSNGGCAQPRRGEHRTGDPYSSKGVATLAKIDATYGRIGRK